MAAPERQTVAPEEGVSGRRATSTPKLRTFFSRDASMVEAAGGARRKPGSPRRYFRLPRPAAVSTLAALTSSAPAAGRAEMRWSCPAAPPGGHQGCQVPFRPPIPNVGLPLRRCSGKGRPTHTNREWAGVLSVCQVWPSGQAGLLGHPLPGCWHPPLSLCGACPLPGLWARGTGGLHPGCLCDPPSPVKM